MCSASTKAATFSNIGTSIAWPSPVRSRWNSAAMMHWVAISPTMWSANTIGTKRGSPSARRLVSVTPAKPWMMVS